MTEKFNILRSVKKAVKEFGMLKKGDRVLVALSGGPDSIALLHILTALQKEFDLSLAAAHLNHKLRGRASDSEEVFVRRTAAKLGIPAVIESRDIKKTAAEKKLTIEEAARDERYRFFEKTAQKLGMSKIATAHTADDQAETVLFRLIRGASEGIAGIPPVRRLGTKMIIRPLYNIWKKDILKFLKEEKIRYRVDKSNFDKKFMRNKIRHHLLPILLKDFNPNIKETILNNAKVLSEITDLTRWEARKIFDKMVEVSGTSKVSLDKSHFEVLHPAIQKEVVRECLRIVKGDLNSISFKNISDILDLALSSQSGKSVNLPGKIIVRNEFGKIVFSKSDNSAAEPPLRRKLKTPGRTEVGNISAETEILAGPDIKKIRFRRQRHRYFDFSGNAAFTEYLDYDAIKFPIYIRSRKPGDRFRPIGMKGEKRLKDIFIEEKVPIELRPKIPVLEDSRGRIIWVAGYRIGEFFKISRKTKKGLKITFALI